MNIHEYQGKQLLKRYDVDVPMGLVVFSAQEGIDLSDELPISISFKSSDVLVAVERLEE